MLKESALLKKARSVREREHRLRPGLRLRTVEQVVEFVHSKGLVSVLGGNELPSIISAFLGRPWKPSGKGFTSWLDWWDLRISNRRISQVLGDLPRRPDIIGTRVFRNSKTLVSKAVWPFLDPVVRQYSKLVKQHAIFSEPEWSIVDVLDGKGSVRTDRLRARLKVEGKKDTARFHRALTRLENRGVIVGYEDPKPEKHIHAAIWQLWDQRITTTKLPALSYERGFARLMEKTLDAAILVSEGEVGKLFPWEGLEEAQNELLASGEAVKAEKFLVAGRLSHQSRNRPISG